jgi:hypothetical protein
MLRCLAMPNMDSIGQPELQSGDVVDGYPGLLVLVALLGEQSVTRSRHPPRVCCSEPPLWRASLEAPRVMRSIEGSALVDMEEPPQRSSA